MSRGRLEEKSRGSIEKFLGDLREKPQKRGVTPQKVQDFEGRRTKLRVSPLRLGHVMDCIPGVLGPSASPWSFENLKLCEARKIGISSVLDLIAIKNLRGCDGLEPS